MEKKPKKSLKGKLSLNKQSLSTIGGPIDRDSMARILGGGGGDKTDDGSGIPSAGSTYTCWNTYNSTCCPPGSGSDTL